MTQTLGRFQLIRLLGEGAQATVWLAHDPRLDREVALKVPGSEADASSVDEWLHEGRAVSRLSHPGIVQVFEADRFDGRPALVFELVHGGTLLPLMRQGAMPARRAVELMVEVLDALAAAHAAGVVHRDLKPSNILIDPAGKPRVTDFGIAARVQDQKAARIVGTPGYISPEAARGEPPHPRMDVFAAGVLLAELLSGQRLLAERDPLRALARVQSEDLHLPPLQNAEVDDALRALVDRALARNPAQRWESAGQLRDALTQWLHQPELAGEGETSDEPQSAALEFLLRRMRTKSDFPALSDSMERVQKLTQSEGDSLATLSGAILKDVALTNKLLRLVNTAQYRHAGGGSINTVSRAVQLIGFAGVRNLALSLVLLERMQDRSHAARLKTEFLRGLMAGSLARELTPNPREGEELFIGTLFQSLGRLLCEFYFPEEAQQVRRLVREGQGTRAPLSEATASARVLGISYEELGVGVAKRWGLPDSLTHLMRRPPGEPPQRLVEQPLERQRWIARAANDTADLMLATEPERLAAPLHRLAEQHAKALRLSAAQFESACTAARERLAHLADAMEIQLERQSPAQRLLPTQDMATVVMNRGDEALAAGALPPDQPTAIDEHSAAARRAQAADQLTAGIQDITDAMVEGQDLGAILRMILETMLRALQLRRVVFCLRDAKSGQLVGRFALGDGQRDWLPSFRVPLQTSGQPDLFSAVCLKGVDTLIADTTAANIAQRLPAWYAGPLRAGSFLLLPLQVKGAAVGLIYADRLEPGSIQLEEKELKLLRTLRNQALMAFRQGG
ncbi:HDOD domain-containing protein [Inhella sp.]|uniref:protein kinase domain-containing protein n=1 Tax=Inhella sp. TaxID=1921806 RepID=UPI0035B1E089